jgi:hypothetical protein
MRGWRRQWPCRFHQRYRPRLIPDRISFSSGSGTGFAGTSFEVGFRGGGTEIIAVPEPEVFASAILILLRYGISRIRRRAKPEASESLIAPNSRIVRCRALVSQGSDILTSPNRLAHRGETA